MTHLLAFAFSLIGFGALAFGTRRQQRDLFRKSLKLSITYSLRICGSIAFFVALGILVAAYGWGVGLVMFSGHTSLAAGAVYVILAIHTGTRFSWSSNKLR